MEWSRARERPSRCSLPRIPTFTSSCTRSPTGRLPSTIPGGRSARNSGWEARRDSESRPAASFDPDVLLADDLAPFHRLGLDEFSELLRCARDDLGALHVELLPHVLGGEDSRERTVEPVDDRA